MTGISARATALLGCAAGALAVHALAPPVYAGALALFALIGGLWLTQALPLAVTALLVPVGAVALGLAAPAAALAPFANPVIFLFLGGFALAAALQRHGLDRALASGVMRLAGGRRLGAVLLLAAMAALLSMWISNTATAAMMLPLALGLLAPLPLDEHRRTWMYVLLGVAFSANIGGIGTLVGSPPNAIAAAAVGMGFAEWMSWGLPLVLVMMPLMEIGLRLVLRPRLDVVVTPPPPPAGWTPAQRRMLALFGFTVLLWVFGAPLGAALGFSQGYDAAVALLALVLLHGFRLAGWQDVERSTEWGVLLLFGGGLTLSKALAASGAAAWLATQLGGPLAAPPAWVCIALMVLFALLLTEVTSNTASAALLIPLFLGLAPHVERAPLAVLVAVGTSCAFMLPVATPPNAIVFGSGHVPQRMMILGGTGVTVLVYPALVLAALIAIA